KADLPVFFPTNSDPLNPHLAITIPSLSQLFQGNTSQVVVTAPDLAAVINSISLGDSLGATVAGLDKLLEVLQNALDGKVFGIDLPLIGDSLKDGARGRRGRSIDWTGSAGDFRCARPGRPEPSRTQ